MAEENKNNIYREKTLERISTPDQLTDYLKVTNPGIWVILAAVIILLAGVFVWSYTGVLETRSPAKVIVSKQTAMVATKDMKELTEGDDRYSQKKDSNQKSFTLSEDEHDLLLKYRELSLKEKTAVKGLCDLLISHN
jgi:hypothetical protein